LIHHIIQGTINISCIFNTDCMRS